MHILGISALYHDSAACLVRDGEIVAAAQEERFSRKKHDAAMPERAIEYCLREANISADDLDFIGFYEKPFRKFDRLMETYLAIAPSGFQSFRAAVPSWLGEKLWLPPQITRAVRRTTSGRYAFVAHHESHAASAFFPSPFDEAAIVTLDGVGEWSTTTIGRGNGNRVSVEHEIRFPHSIGLLYSAFTSYCGFGINEGEYKLMGLAPYGEPRFYGEIMGKLFVLKDDGSFWMDMSYFNYLGGLTMTSEKFHRAFNGLPRKQDEPITQRHMDVAASVQRVTEEAMVAIARHALTLTGSRNLVLAGGVALNCVGNGRILRELDVDNIWIQPAAGDAGGALGTALYIWYQLLGRPRSTTRMDSQKGSFLGPRVEPAAAKHFLDGVGAAYQTLSDEALVERVARLIADGQIVGWIQGRMEFGPRALGARSILGDARDSRMQSTMNVKIKFRESFRPFAPSILREHVSEYFEMDASQESAYMLLVAPVRESHRLPATLAQTTPAGFERLKVPRSDIPAATHVDYSARIQTVDRQRHGRFRALLERFALLTGCPVMVNTSFNLSSEPIVNTAEDAYRTFMACDMDALVIEDMLLIKAEQRVKA